MRRGEIDKNKSNLPKKKKKKKKSNILYNNAFKISFSYFYTNQKQ